MTNKTLPVFLISPLNSAKYKEVLVLADSEQSARSAALSLDDVYTNKGMSTCILVEPHLLNVDDQCLNATIKYHEVVYHLVKGEPQIVIAEAFL